MTEQDLLEQLNTNPSDIEFNDVMSVIEQNYIFQPVEFSVGQQTNQCGENLGSCKALAFAKLHGVSAELTPYLFGQYYRRDVLEHPDENDHQNIRNFLKHGWKSVKFDAEPLKRKV
ncbi:type III effector [Oleiphilus sp. HI0071]|jgi:hypothetical protein|uniref:HopJ type III effector protein n=1 Tax=unclassified Oleiphilus TaxID=2631174 RepID=UPI0007C27E18|nr:MULTISPECIES: HopJ type III effector protein [unclassified Oleiphilus]KZY68179.1 type III effector [Oleiphilus sp. HI0065]KZY81154.1 type III effector [Oleiphilus sp. HI0071]KZY92715.1 type III effector [Oleiphilus sp. HI0073]KZZ43003.1 type III effector [Oleiphilus sp. HI0118]KZZ49944.1 type III effector [Oleiphilus sp. HI0122]KZZ65264.1 type III effector [Oleiphilus sp. HI0130]KZZ77442.1 type III effector [Oleiphilus sp. HI0133]